jgi:hypothetical protein
MKLSVARRFRDANPFSRASCIVELSLTSFFPTYNHEGLVGHEAAAMALASNCSPVLLRRRIASVQY